MNKAVLVISIVLLVGLLCSTFGCTVASSTKDNGLFGTEKTTTTVGSGGVSTTTKNCPFWNPNC